MKLTHKLTALALSASLLGSTAVLTSCKSKKNVPDTDQTLEVFATNAGYGIQWLVDLLNAFKEEDWVKEKYPNLQIPDLENNLVNCIDSVTIPADKVASGAGANSADLIISCQPANTQYNAKDSAGNGYFEELSDVYDSEVPGETGVKVKDKMDSVVYDQLLVTKSDGTSGYYAMPWIRGTTGFFYNKTRLESIVGADYELPRTTDEFISLAGVVDAAVKKQNKSDGAFVLDNVYLGGVPVMWWAQYEGYENYSKYWECKVYSEDIDDYIYSADIFKQQGRLEALDVMQKLLGADNNSDYVALTSHTDTFMTRQTYLAWGERGVFTDNGDWFLNEMSGYLREDQTVDMLRIPVISSLVDKLSSVNTDAQLSLVVSYVDEDKTYEEAKAAYSAAGHGDLTQADYERVFEARYIINRMTGHEIFIPSYANGKEVAKDFLRFMATDKAIRIFTKAGSGYVSPFNADVSDLYGEFNAVGKTHHDWMKHAVELPALSSYRTYMFGGLTAWGKYSHSLGSAVAPYDKGAFRSAETLYNDIITTYTANNGASFELILVNSGLRK